MKAATFLSLFVGYACRAQAATYTVTTCDELVTAAQETAIEDTVIELNTTTIDCAVGYQTLVVEDNVLTVQGSDAISFSVFDIGYLRIEVKSSGKLIWVPSTDFKGNWRSVSGFDLELNGGWLNVEEDATARFEGDVEARYYRINSVTDEGTDFSSDMFFGGCIFNQGYTVFEGEARFRLCEVQGGGESDPGDGGAIYNTETGSMLFEDGLRIEEVSLTENDGGAGAGIANWGKINVKGEAYFEDLRTDDTNERGGAIFNAEGAKFFFRQKATAYFRGGRANAGGAVYNAGRFNFTGEAFFHDNGGTAIVNAEPGVMKLAAGSVFWNNFGEQRSGAIANLEGAILDIRDDITYIGNYILFDDEPFCEGIYNQISSTEFECLEDGNFV